jgi:hypothetical protein
MPFACGFVLVAGLAAVEIAEALSERKRTASPTPCDWRRHANNL